MTYEIVRSGRRTLSVEIRRDGSVLVRAPYGSSQKRIELFLREKESWINAHVEKQLSRPPLPEDEKTVSLLRDAAKRELIPLVWQKAGEFGFQVKSVRITAARSRFGSCSAENRICLSLYLMQYPEKARLYVVMHELCHTVEHNHSPRFYALLDRVLPGHREDRKLLR